MIWMMRIGMKTSGRGGGRVVDKDDEATGSPSVRGPGAVVPMPQWNPEQRTCPIPALLTFTQNLLCASHCPFRSSSIEVIIKKLRWWTRSRRSHLHLRMARFQNNLLVIHLVIRTKKVTFKGTLELSPPSYFPVLLDSLLFHWAIPR